MTQKRMTCILCPNGCDLDVAYHGEPSSQTLFVQGNLCPKGERYALEELLHPKRTLTTSILVRGGAQPQTSVKTAAAIPRETLHRARDALRAIAIDAPVEIGDIVARDIAATGVDVVVTRRVRRTDGVR